MEIKSLSRSEFFHTARALKSEHAHLCQHIPLDERSLGSLPGDTFGEMCEQGEKIARRETRVRQTWFAGQAVATVGAGALALPAVAALWHGNSAMWAGDPLCALAIGAGLYGVSLYCRKQVLNLKPVEEAAHQRDDHLRCWSYLLQEGERLATEKNLQTGTR